MSLLNTINHSSVQEGLKIIIAGVEGAGKTTLGVDAPNPLLFPLEKGFAGVNVDKTDMVTSFDAFMQALVQIEQALIAQQFPYLSIVVDSASALERIIHEYSIAVDPKAKVGTTMETAHGGYGKAYQHATNCFHSFLTQCDKIASYGINVVITCHVCATEFIDPQYGAFTTWDLLLHSPKDGKKFGKRELITQWADIIGFLHEPMYITKGEGDAVSKGVSANQGIMLGVKRDPAFVAKNRFGLTELIPIPEQGGWNAIAQKIYDSRGLNYFKQ